MVLRQLLLEEQQANGDLILKVQRQEGGTHTVCVVSVDCTPRAPSPISPSHTAPVQGTDSTGRGTYRGHQYANLPV